MSDDESTCSCGQCIDGWLSPRMRERLEGEGDFLHFASKGLEEGLHNDPDILQDGILSELIIGADVTLHYIPMELHEKMTAGFYSGYIFVLLTIVRLFLHDGPDESDEDEDNAKNPESKTEEAAEESGNVEAEDEDEGEAEEEDDQPRYPTLDNVNQQLSEIQAAAKESDASDDTKTDAAIIAEYLDAGGKAEYALEAVVDVAWENSPAGTNYVRTPNLQKDEEEFEKGCEGLPKCANDLNFKLVRTKLGLSPERNGPHWFFLTDIEDEEDEDEEGGEALYTGVKADATAEDNGKSPPS